MAPVGIRMVEFAVAVVEAVSDNVRFPWAREVEVSHQEGAGKTLLHSSVYG